MSANTSPFPNVGSQKRRTRKAYGFLWTASYQLNHNIAYIENLNILLLYPVGSGTAPALLGDSPHSPLASRLKEDGFMILWDDNLLVNFLRIQRSCANAWVVSRSFPLTRVARAPNVSFLCHDLCSASCPDVLPYESPGDSHSHSAQHLKYIFRLRLTIETIDRS